MAYKLYKKDSTELLGEFSYHHLAVKFANRNKVGDYRIDYISKDEQEFSRKDVFLFDRNLTAYKHSFLYDNHHRR